MDYGAYNAKKFALDQYNKELDESSKDKKKTQGCLVDDGITIQHLAQSEVGQIYN